MNVRVIYREQGRDPYTDVPHTHESDYELIHVLSGKGKVFVGERVIPFCGESVFLLDAAVLHYVSPEADVPYVRTKLLIDKSLTGGMVLPLLERGCLYRAPTPELSGEADRALSALQALLKEGTEPLLICAHIFELLHLCTAKMSGERSYYRGTMADVVRHIHENLGECLSLCDVADRLHINKYHLCRLFKRETGMTVNCYINSARIAKAKQLLATSEESVSFIATECGFGELSLFTKNFKKEMGMTPSAYRNLTRS